jgi:hypothetical protein
MKSLPFSVQEDLDAGTRTSRSGIGVVNSAVSVDDEEEEETSDSERQQVNNVGYVISVSLCVCVCIQRSVRYTNANSYVCTAEECVHGYV